MTEPKLWSDPATDATSLERTLLAAGRHRRMPDADRRAGLERLASILHAPGLQPSPAPAPAAPASPSLFATPLAKGLVVCAGIAALATTGLLLRRARPSEPVAPTAPAAARATAVSPSVVDGPPAATSAVTTPLSAAPPGPSTAVGGAAPA